MSSPNFVYQWRLLSGSKVDLVPLEGGDLPENYFTADGDHTPLMQSLDDIRRAAISGTMHGFARQPNGVDVPSGSLDYLFVTSSTGDLYFSKFGTLIQITAGSAVNATAGSGPFFWSGSLGVGTSKLPGITLAEVTAATAGAQKYSPLAELAGQGFATTPSRSDGVRFALQTRPVQGANNPTGDLVIWSATGSDPYTEMLKFAKSAGVTQIISTDATLRLLGPGGDGFTIEGGLPQLWAGGIGSWQWYSTYFIPLTDNTKTVGLTSNRLSNVYTVGISADVSTLTASSAVPNSANAVGTMFDTTTGWTNTDARIVQVKNNAALKASVDVSGNYIGPSSFSMPELFAVTASNVQTQAASYTYGELIVPMRSNMVLAGARFYFPGGIGATSVKVSLWDSSGNRVTSVTVNVNAADIYTATFSSPQKLTAWQGYALSVWETGGNINWYMINATLQTQTGGALQVADLRSMPLAPGFFRRDNFYQTGDSYPNTLDTTNILAGIEPIFI